MRVVLRVIALMALAPALGGCQTLSGQTLSGQTLSSQTQTERAVPATVDLSDAGVRLTLMTTLSRALHRQPIVFAPTLTPNTTFVSVLPRALGHLETNSPAMPIRFDIVRQNDQCRAIREDTKEVIDLPGSVNCIAVGE